MIPQLIPSFGHFANQQKWRKYVRPKLGQKLSKWNERRKETSERDPTTTTKNGRGKQEMGQKTRKWREQKDTVVFNEIFEFFFSNEEQILLHFTT